MNEHFIALKNKFNNEKDELERRMRNLEDEIRKEEINNRQKKHKIEILQHEYKDMSEKHKEYKAKRLDEID